MRTPVPGPTPRPVIGTIHTLDPDALVQSNMRLAARYGEIFRHQVPGQPPTYIVSSRRLVDELCDETRFDKCVHNALEHVRAFAGDGLFTARTEEQAWQTAHRVLMPAFAPTALASMFDDMTDLAEQLVLKWERLGPDAEIDVVSDFTRLTLDTIALCAFSFRFNSFYSESMHPFVDAMVYALHESGQRSRRLDLQTRLMVPTRRRYARSIEVMNDIADRLVADRRANPLPDGQHDILDTMLHATDGEGRRLSDENVRYQLVTFLIAGHETTSGLLGFAVHALLAHPEVARRAQAQVDAVLDGRFPTREDLPRLGYLDQVLRETLRLWPTAPAFGLFARESTTIGDSAPGAGDGYRIEPQDTVLVLTPALHRDPAVWDDPERFDPDRFDFDRVQALPPNAWKPFGNGHRSCIGRGFALQEAQLVLALLLQRFELHPVDPDYRLRIKETLTFKPEGLRARLVPRTTRWRPRTDVQAPAASSGDARSAPRTAGPPPSHGTTLRVHYGSNAGTARSFAEQLADEARRRGYAPTVAALDDAVDTLGDADAALVVTASYEGRPPDNAARFVDWVTALPGDALHGLPFAVLGCGNTDWARTYQRIPTLVDESLAAAGGTRVVARGETNARGDLVGAFEGWSAELWPALAQTLGIDAADVHPDLARPGPEATVVPSGDARPAPWTDPGLGLAVGTVVENGELTDTSGPDPHSKRHVVVDLPEGQEYRAGDYLVVLPRNPAAVVDRVLARTGLSHDSAIRLSGRTHGLPENATLLAGELFAAHVELSAPAARSHVQRLAEACPCPPDRAALTRLASEDIYSLEILDRRVSLLDLLERFPAVQLPLGDLLGMLPPLAPRRYSISSSPRWDTRRATITVAHLDAPARSGVGRHQGVASTFLARLPVGARLPVAVRPGPEHFRPPTDLATPLVMICAGSGIAPFRGFLQDRALRAAAEAATPGPALLFHGCRQPGVDDLYRKELDAWQADGLVEVRRAFSRRPEQGPDGPVRYVQDRLWADRAEVADLVHRGAVVLVCGDAERMAPAVRATCARIHADATGCDEPIALAWLEEQERENRYVADLFA